MKASLFFAIMAKKLLVPFRWFRQRFLLDIGTDDTTMNKRKARNTHRKQAQKTNQCFFHGCFLLNLYFSF